jgi:hypothetical protein
MAQVLSQKRTTVSDELALLGTLRNNRPYVDRYGALDDSRPEPDHSCLYGHYVDL